MRIVLASLLALSLPGVVRGEDPPDRRAPGDRGRGAPPVREEMASLEARLEGAVSRVSVPHAGVLLGRTSSSRGYRLPGYGIVFVLTPRALPGEGELLVMRHPRGKPGPGVRIERHVTPGESGWEPHRLEEIERQVLVLQHAAEATRRAAEEDMDRLVRDVRVRLEVHRTGEEGDETHDVAGAEAGDAPPPPAAAWVAEGPGEAGPPPWRFWFEGEAGPEERSPDRIVGEVRDAVLETLDSEGGSVGGLAPEEYVTVAVDFVPGGIFATHQRPARTLIVRVRQGDLAARARGKIASEELRGRVEVIEY